MLYLYTLLMLSWDLDADTHQYFRIYLAHFIHLRRLSKDIRKIAQQLKYIPLTRELLEKEGMHMRTALRPYEGIWAPRISPPPILRLPINIYRTPYCISSDYKEEIDKKHSTKYYIAGLLGEHDTVRIDSSTIAATIKFPIPSNERLIEICKLYNSNASTKIGDVMVYVNGQYHMRSVPNERVILRYLMKVEDH